MLKFSFTIPSWLEWLIPAWLKQDHARRIELTGNASTSFLKGAVTITSGKPS